MVVESILQAVLSRYLDKMFYGITRQNIKAEVLKGRFVISNIGLRESLFFGSNMPYDLRHSYVQKIQITINWTSNQRVLAINISKIYALLSMKQDFENMSPDGIFMQIKKSNIKDYITEIVKNESSKLDAEKEKKNGGISGFLKRLLDNVNINIKSIHLRFQDQPRRYCFGLRIEQIQIINVDQRENPEFFNREKTDQNYINYRLKIDPLQIYLNPNESNFLHKKDYAEITNQMIVMDNNRRMEGSEPFMFEAMSQWSQGAFTNILTISIKSLLKRYIARENTDLPQYECKITFNIIESVISDDQFHIILSIINKMTEYQGKLQNYKSQTEISPFKQREGKQIINLIKKPKTSKKEKEVVKKMAIKFLTWVFKQNYLQIMKKRFIQEAVKKDITIQNLFDNKKTKKIIRKVPIFRIKQWIQICMDMRKRHQVKDKKQLKIITVELQEKQEKQVILKLIVEINKLDVKISKNGQFGIRALMENTKINLLKRRSNFYIEIAVEDLITDVFKLSYGQKFPTFVPILRKSTKLEDRNTKDYLLKLQFEKCPIGKPFVFSQSKLNFQSIQITIYPQVFSKFYQIFLKDKEIEKKHHNKKKKPTIKRRQPVNNLAGTGFQYNIIEGFIQSPWIIIPLSHTNDSSKDSWVLRLGDLNIQTPSYESSMKSDHRLFYERYFIHLKNFQLKYFTSVNFFFIWLQHSESIQSLQSLPGFKNSKYIDMIEPISCAVDLSVMKKHVSSLVKNSRQSIMAEIKIQKVFIRLPKLLLDKLKHRVDIFDDFKRDSDFMETSAKNVLEQNMIEGLVKVTNEKFKDMTFYAALKGYYLYFFFKDKDNREDIIFSSDVRETSIRLTSDHHSYINEGKPKKLNIELKQKQNHGLWKKYLTQLVSKRDRIYDKNYDNLSLPFSVNQVPQEHQPKTKNKKTSIVKNNNSFIQEISQSQMSYKEEDVQRIAEKSGNYSSFSFLMQSLSILLIDQKQQEFMYCIFKKTQLSYSNLKEKTLTFSIMEWKILEKDKINESGSERSKAKDTNKRHSSKNIPFLSCKRLIKQDNKNYVSKKEIEQTEDNFLQVKVFYNNITGQLNQINIDVDQLYISWNIHIFNKILKFFFYKSEVADVPTAPSTLKKSLIIRFNMKRFYLYCFHDEELFALLKLHEITINYSQSSIEQQYIVNCRKFEMDKYVDNDQNKRVPMIFCHNKMLELKNKMQSCKSMQLSENDSLKLEQSIFYENEVKKDQGNNDEREGHNPMYLQYVVRKQKTEKYPNVTKLKKKFGHDLLVSQIKCTWKDFIIFFDMEQTIRMINYFINQILGTVAAKFKKKQYSLNYISEVLKIKKITTFDIKFNNFTVILTPHSRVDHFFQIKIQKVDFSKNKRDDKPEFQPKLIKVQTQRGQIQLFYDTMVFEILNVIPYYQFRLNPSQQLTRNSLNIFVTYGKLGFMRQHQPILKQLQDIDRTIKVSVKITPGFQLQLQKITFLTILQIYYQNIQHKDGKAQRFQIPHPVPSLKTYQIDLGAVELYFYEYLTQFQMDSKLKQTELSILTSMDLKSSGLYAKNMQPFQKISAENFKVLYQNVGSNSKVQLVIQNVYGAGELPVSKNNQVIPSNLTLTMTSDGIENLLKLIPNNLCLNVNLDKLNHIIQFTNYDSEYVSNKIMPKRTKDSFMTVNIFPQKCCARVGELQLYGQMIITYTKDFKNVIDIPIIKYLFQQKLSSSQNEQKIHSPQYLKDQVSDKEIKVNCQNLVIYLNKKYISVLKRMFYSRVEYSAKQTLRKFKKEFVMIDGLHLMINILELQKLYLTYVKFIKKAIDYKDKIMLLPFQQVNFNKKSTLKRITEVQFEKSTVNLMRVLPQHGETSIAPFMSYMTIQFIIPKITYATYLKEQLISITDLNAKIMQNNQIINQKKILELAGVRLQYLQNKEDHSKYIEIQNAKNIKINIRNMSDQLLALLAKEVISFKKIKNIQKHRTSCEGRIVCQSLVMKRHGDVGTPLLSRESTQSIRQNEQFYLLFENTTDKKIELLINNFSFEENFDKNNKSSKSILITTGQSKSFNISGIKLLQFLNQSAKQKPMLTEIGFKQEGHGPIVIKSIQEIMANEEVELFSSCSLKYMPMVQSIKFQIFQPCSIVNTTNKTFSLCLLDRRKKKLCSTWIQAKALNSINLNSIDSTPEYLILQYSNNIQLQSINTSTYPSIKISNLSTNLNPNKIGPVQLYPSSMLQIIRWLPEGRSNSQRFQLIFFNRYRLQNNLPVSIEANFTTIQPFRQRVIESSSRTTTSNVQSHKLSIRVNSIYEIQYQLYQVIKYFQSYFTSSNSIPKKKQTEITEMKVRFQKKDEKQLFYSFLVCSKIGYRPNNLLAELKNKNKNIDAHINASSNCQYKIPSRIQNFILNNQIVIAVNCSQIMKNKATSNGEDGKFVIGWFAGAHEKEFDCQKGNTYLMIPQGITGLYFERQLSNKQQKAVKYEIKKDESPSIKFWGKYSLITHSKNMGSNETIFILDDICTIENKTSKVMQASYKNLRSVNSFDKNSAIAITIFPAQKVNIPIKIDETDQNMGGFIEISAYCRQKNKKQIAYHLVCTTKLQLKQSWEKETKKMEQKEQEEAISGEDILYWYLNPTVAYYPQQFSKYDSEVIKVVSKKSYIKNSIKYQFLFQDSNEEGGGELNTKFAYFFKNNLPTNYALIIRQENGQMPEQWQVSKKMSEYYQQVDEQKEMAIPCEIDSPIKTNKKKKESEGKNDSLSEAHGSYKSLKLELSREQNLGSSQSKVVEYVVSPNGEIQIGLTNLEISGKKPRTFVVEIYRTDCNLEFNQNFIINVLQPFKQSMTISIYQDQNKLKHMRFQGSEQPESDENNSQRLSSQSPNFRKKEKKISKQNFKQHQIHLFCHKNKDFSYEFYVESQDILKNKVANHDQLSYQKKTTELKIFQISLTIEITANPKDTLTLELQNLKLNFIQLPPNSHTNKIDLKVDKLLIRQDRNLSILQMLHPNRQLLAISTQIEKVMSGNRFNNLIIKLEPLQMNVREGIMFKILSRIVEIRNYYFMSGQKLDQTLNSTPLHQHLNSSKNIVQQNYAKKLESKLYQNYELQCQKQIKKQKKKSNPKLLLINNLKVASTNTYLSFSKDQYAQNKQQFVHDPIIKYFILIPAVSGLKIAIPSIEVQDFTGVNGQLAKLVLKQIKHNIGETLLRSLSALTVLDSPVAAIDGVFQYLQAIMMINRS